MEGDSPNGVVIDPMPLGDEHDDGVIICNVDIGFNDPFCAFCKQGGYLLCCEGPCLRSFHATKTSGKDYGCRSLGFTRGQRDEPFSCTNCTNRQHHCVGCRVLGSSDAANAQVFRCSHATRGHLTCGRFYHPPCIGAELHPGDLAEAARCRDRVAAGGAFQCPGPHRRH